VRAAGRQNGIFTQLACLEILTFLCSFYELRPKPAEALTFPLQNSVLPLPSLLAVVDIACHMAA